MWMLLFWNQFLLFLEDFYLGSQEQPASNLVGNLHSLPPRPATCRRSLLRRQTTCQRIQFPRPMSRTGLPTAQTLPAIKTLEQPTFSIVSKTWDSGSIQPLCFSSWLFWSKYFWLFDVALDQTSRHSLTEPRMLTDRPWRVTSSLKLTSK